MNYLIISFSVVFGSHEPSLLNKWFTSWQTELTYRALLLWNIEIIITATVKRESAQQRNMSALYPIYMFFFFTNMNQRICVIFSFNILKKHTNIGRTSHFYQKEYLANRHFLTSCHTFSAWHPGFFPFRTNYHHFYNVVQSCLCTYQCSHLDLNCLQRFVSQCTGLKELMQFFQCCGLSILSLIKFLRASSGRKLGCNAEKSAMSCLWTIKVQTSMFMFVISSESML